jgi:hypothetical protein
VTQLWTVSKAAFPHRLEISDRKEGEDRKAVENHFDRYRFGSSAFRSNSSLKCRLQRSVRSRRSDFVPDKDLRLIGPGQAKRIRHSHERPHAEDEFGLEEKSVIDLKWKPD